MNIKKIALLAAVVLIMGSCGTSTTKHTDSRTVDDSIQLAKNKFNQDSIAAARKAEQADLEKKITALKQKFIITKDELSGVEIYNHKTWGKYWPQRKTLTAYATSEGRSFLESNYFNDDWIFHENITIKIDDVQLSTQPVPSYDKANRTENNADGIYEVVRYMDGGAILAKIAEDPKKKVYLRFHGRQYYDETYLSASDKNALKDTWQLAEYISYLKLSEMGI